jgi:hypothetical protein
VIAAIALGWGSNAAQAADAAKKMAATPDQVADAKAQVAAIGLACNIVNVRYQGSGKNKINGKDVDLNGYEIACDDGGGYAVNGVKGGSPDSFAVSCLALDSQKKLLGDKAKFQTCQLPENKNVLAQAQTYADRAHLNSCKVDKADYFGSSKTNKDVFYEVSCGGQTSYVLRVVAGAGDKVESLNCLKAAGQGLACKLSPPERQGAPVIALAKTSGKACDITKVRYVVTDPKNGEEYYEVGCAGGKAGYMAVVNSAGALSRTVDCGLATSIAGGCTLTDAATIATEAAANLASRLKATGVPCTFEKGRLIGRVGSHSQDIVEYACSDRPRGLVLVLPTDDGGKLEVYDCISVGRFRAQCEYTPKAAIMAELGKIVEASNRHCAVSDYAFLGSGDDNTYEVEVACSGGIGYILEAPRDSVGKARTILSCLVSEKQGVACSIPGNH